MNVVGSIGQFFINYQTEIEGTVFVLLILLTLYLFVKYVSRDRKNTKKIAELTAKVESIENQVASKGVATVDEVKSQVEKIEPKEAEASKPAEQENILELIPTAATEEKAVEETAAVEVAAETPTPIAEPSEPVDQPENAKEVILEGKVLGPKFSSRDYDKDRLGNVYTEEMLREQIG